MICDFLKLWELLTYDGLKSHMNVTEGLKKFSEYRIKVGKGEDGTRDLNQ